VAVRRQGREDMFLLNTVVSYGVRCFAYARITKDFSPLISQSDLADGLCQKATDRLEQDDSIWRQFIFANHT